MDAVWLSRQNHGVRRRVLVGLMTIATAVYIGLAIWSMPEGMNDAGSLIWILVAVPVGMVFPVILMWRRPGHPIGELLLVGLFASLMLLTILEIVTLIVFERDGAQGWMWLPIWLAQTGAMAGVVAISVMLALLPDGRVRDIREKRFVHYSWFVITLPAVALISNRFVDADSMSFPGVTGIESPVVFEGLLAYGPAFSAAASLGYGVLFVGVALQVMRYRKAPLRERKQVRWVLYGGVLIGAVPLVPYLLSELGVTGPLVHGLDLNSVLSSLAIIVFPATVFVSVMEPSWIDVDIVIRKSLVYGALSFVILLLYVGVASTLGVAVGQRLQIELAVFLTVVVAVLFQPARRWLQDLADRWVFGDRPSKYAALTEMGDTIDRASDPYELLRQLVETIQKAIRVGWVQARLDDGPTASTGRVNGEVVLTVPISAGSQTFGVISCGRFLQRPKDRGEAKLVETLASQVGLAIANAQLAGRIVTAAEEERRRIERNIHDGAQQELVALVARLGMAKGQVVRGSFDPADLDQLQSEVRRILSGLRDLAQGIHPSVLTDGGLLEAVEERCSHLPIDVQIEASPGLRSRRFGDDVEGAAYFFVTEALTNVLKHSDASRAWVTMNASDGGLTMSVRDDGRGFDTETTTVTGLGGLADRIQALGGSVRVTSRVNTGTEVRAILPVGK
jgi:signal transduction histidine kinase